MIKICSLGSGSRGNCIFIGTEKTKILIDAGFSGLKIKDRLRKIGEDISLIDAILVSHEHSDHIRGVKTLSNSNKIPVFYSKDFPEFFHEKVKFKEFFSPGEEFKLKEFSIETFSLPHDAEDPVGFSIRIKDIKIGIATDLGKVNNLIVNYLKNSNVLFVEFNHDENLLLNGPYPWELKQRIFSPFGHLSNVEAVNLIKEISWEGLTDIFISHISEKNNSFEKIKLEIEKNINNLYNFSKFHFTFQENISHLLTM